MCVYLCYENEQHVYVCYKNMLGYHKRLGKFLHIVIFYQGCQCQTLFMTRTRAYLVNEFNYLQGEFSNYSLFRNASIIILPAKMIRNTEETIRGLRTYDYGRHCLN